MKMSLLLAKKVAQDEDLPFAVVIEYKTRDEVTSPLYNGKYAAITTARKIADRTGEKTKVVYRPSNQVVWKSY